MSTRSRRSHAREYVDSLMAAGRYTFTSKEARAALGASLGAVKMSLARLAKQKLIASPGRGFYVIVPPEYQSLGCLPAEQFIAEFMSYIRQPYYVGLLSAAQYHGAAHHRPQTFQVVIPKARREIRCGKVRVSFAVKQKINSTPLQNINTPRGSIKVSTPEATALDLIGYYRSAGGMENAATVIAELAERIDPEKLADVAKTVPVPWTQRLGYILEVLDLKPKARALKKWLDKINCHYVPLQPGLLVSDTERNPRWKVMVDSDLQIET